MNDNCSLTDKTPQQARPWVSLLEEGWMPKDRCPTIDAHVWRPMDGDQGITTEQ